MNHSSYTPCYDDDTLLFNINLQHYEIAQFQLSVAAAPLSFLGYMGWWLWCGGALSVSAVVVLLY